MTIAVVGLGRLGLPMAALFRGVDDVIGIDIRQDICDDLNQGIVRLQEPHVAEMIRLYGSIDATTDFGRIKEADATFIVVPTPSDVDGWFRNDYIYDALSQMAPALKERKERSLVVVCSTIMPGSSVNILATLERLTEKKTGEDLGYCYSPEFIALGDVVQGLRFPDLVLIGAADERSGEECRDILRRIHGIPRPPIHVMKPVNAEIAKLALNAYVTMKISWSNALGELCDSVPDADPYAIVDAIGEDRRVGRAYLSPATPFAGPCFPRDAVAYRELLKTWRAPTQLAQATIDVNERQVERIVRRAYCAASNYRKAAVLGWAFKPGTPVTDASPSPAVAELLSEVFEQVAAFDPIAVVPDPFGVDTLDQCLADADIAIIMTPDPAFKGVQAPAVLDLWNVSD